MVRVKEPDDYDKLDDIVKTLCSKHGLTLYVDGWARKSYKIYREDDKPSRKKELLASLESFAVQSGVITYHDDSAMDFCHELGEALEKEFDVEEAVLHKE
jgi:hypothetical protein